MRLYTKEQEQNIYKAAVKLWGRDLQFGMLIEECAELIQAVNKLWRGHQNGTDRLVDELADVQIMLNQAAIIVGQEQVNTRIQVKLARVADKLGVVYLSSNRMEDGIREGTNTETSDTKTS